MFEHAAYRDIGVAPYESFLMARFRRPIHAGGPDWPDWDAEPAHRFGRVGALADTRVPVDLATAEPVAGDHHWWIGPLTTHFGHFILEIASRILPTLTLDPEAVPVFGADLGADPPTLTPPVWLAAIGRWFGAEPERFRIVARPSRFERLRVVPQQERLGQHSGGALEGASPTEAYLDLLTALTDRRLGRQPKRGTLYVSRAGMTARFAGEAVLEAAFTAAGATVIRPETMALEDQLRAYHAHELVVVAEGSALHGMQLLGRGLGRIVVLPRRAGWTLGAAHLGPRAEAIEWVDAVDGLVHGRRLDGDPNRMAGLTHFRPERALPALKAAGIDLGPHLSPQAFREAQRADLAEWAAGPGRAEMLRTAASARHVLQTLRASGLPGAETTAARLAARAGPPLLMRRARRLAGRLAR